jgi:hypothetical protein
MGIIRIGGRGTTRRQVSEKEKDNWSGEAFKDVMAKQKETAKDRYITMGRGTAKIKFGDIADTTVTSSKGMWVSTGRGTGKRRIQ